MIRKVYDPPYYLVIRPKFRIGDCQEYTDPYLKKSFTLCFKNLLIKVGEDEYIPRTAFMYSLNTEYRLRKGRNYYHKETPLHNYNDKTMFDLVKKLKRKKFSYIIKPAFSSEHTEESIIKPFFQKTFSLVQGYFDTLFLRRGQGDEYYHIGRILALTNTTVTAIKNIHKTISGSNKNVIDEYNHIYPISIESLILFPTLIAIKEINNMKIVRVGGYGNLGYNHYLNINSNVRLAYNYDEYSIGLIITGDGEVLIPEKHWYIDDLIVNKFSFERFLFTRISDWKQFYIDKNYKLTPLQKNESTTKEYDDYYYDARTGSRINVKKIHTQEKYIMTFNYPRMTFKQMRDTIVKLINQ